MQLPDEFINFYVIVKRRIGRLSSQVDQRAEKKHEISAIDNTEPR